MNRFLSSIGFNNIEDQEQVETLLRKMVTDTSDRQFIRKKTGTVSVEYRTMVSEHAGICVCGEEDQNEKFHVTHYFPFCTNNNSRYEEFVLFNKKTSQNEYAGMCDDKALGATIIFYVTNVADYKYKYKESNDVDDVFVEFSGLSTKGNVILPVAMRSVRPETILKKLGKKIKEEEKNEDDAKDIISLSMEDLDKMAMINRRIQKEDILSIVESSLIPHGTETDMYLLVGEIRRVIEEKNRYTGEEMYILLVSLNSILINIAINKKDLYGEPAVGRRFRGSIWLQGKVVDRQIASFT